MPETIDDALLCRLAGELWAVFAPWRGPWTGGGGGGGAAAVYLARRAFREGAGLRWRHSGRDRIEREENVEALGRLERAGLLERRVEKTKVVAVQLFEAGIERACALASAPCWRAGRRACERLVRHEAQGGCVRERDLRWAPEWALAGAPAHWSRCGDDEAGRENRRRLAALEDEALPALVRGWLESGSDLHGRVWYALTETGRAALAGARPAGDSGAGDDGSEVESLAGDHDDCALAWREGAHAMYARVASAPRSEREIGLLPLPSRLSSGAATAPAGGRR